MMHRGSNHSSSSGSGSGKAVSLVYYFILTLLLILSTVPQTGNAEELPDCRMGGVLPSEGENISAPALNSSMAIAVDGSVSCLLHSDTTVLILLGSQEGRLLSPLRNSLFFTGAHNISKTKESGKLSFFKLLAPVKRLLHRFSLYPWTDMTALERFFFQRRFRLDFELDVPSSELISRIQLLSRAVFDYIRVTSFPPTAELTAKNKVARLGCDFDTVLHTHRNVSKSSSFMSRLMDNIGVGTLTSFLFPGGGGRNSYSAIPNSVGEDVSSPPSSRGMMGTLYLFEELGPNGRSSLSLPSWIAAWLGTRPMATREALLLGNEGRYKFLFEAQLHVTNPVCLRLTGVRPKGVEINIEEVAIFDMLWLKIILCLCLLWFLKPWVEDIQAFQIVLAGLGSIIVLIGFIFLFVLRKLQSMTLGKVGLFAVLAMGGFSALVESLLSAYATFLYTYFAYDNNSDLASRIACVLLVIGLACGFFAKYFWSNYLSALTQWTLRWTQLGIITCAVMQNREATFLFLVLSFVFYPSRVLRFIIWCSRSEGLENRENDPLEKFPVAARREVPYAPPLCEEGFIGGSRALSAEEKLRLYDALGNEYTQRALAHLARCVKEDPGRYTSRLKNPNDVKSWAQKFR